MPFGVANTPALFQELMNKIFYILGRRPPVQELISREAEMEAHIDDLTLGTNTQEDHVLLLREFFTVCRENHLRIKLEKCEFMKEEMEYFGFEVGYGWWKPAASKMQPLLYNTFVRALLGIFQPFEKPTKSTKRHFACGLGLPKSSNSLTAPWFYLLR